MKSPKVKQGRRFVEYMALSSLAPATRNPKRHSLAAIGASYDEHGFVEPVILDERTGRLVAGHGRRAQLIARKEAGKPPPEGIEAVGDDWLIPVGRGWASRTDAEADAYLLASNRLVEVGGWQMDELVPMLRHLEQSESMEAIGWSSEDLAAMVAKLEAPPPGPPQPTLKDRFLVPPFSVLDARQGYWQDRKRAWLAIGIKSEVGRGENLLAFSETAMEPDPVKRAAKKAKRKADARTFGQDPMRGEHAVGQNGYDKLKRPNGHLDAKAQKALGVYFSKGGALDRGAEGEAQTGTSIFDPVLCELAYRWFVPGGGAILDPFAGGSVRGIVAAKLGYRYTGIELRPEQVAANRGQWEELGPRIKVAAPAADPADFMPELSPVERHGEIWAKRDDLFAVAGVQGGKVRSCWGLAQGAAGLVTAGSRASPQVNIVAHIARRLGLPCRVHTPTGDPSPEVAAAVAAGAELVQHKAGYNNVIIARAREDAERLGWANIPFGMECQAAVDATRGQVGNIPKGAKRLVVPVGSGMSLAGILWGLKDAKRKIQVIGVVVGADPKKRLDKWAPPGWRDMVQLVPSGLDYHDDAPVQTVEDLVLDPVYEAKCIPFLEPDDCLWCVGIRQTAAPAAEGTEAAPAPRWIEGDSQRAAKLCGPEAAFDFLFSCPPYADLERYSDDPRDLSTMEYEAFHEAYRKIIAGAVKLLRPNRFACFVIGDVRGPNGTYRNFVSHTIAAFQDAGAALYNEAILVTCVGSLPIRAGKQFTASRKLGRTHQNVLVFVKGDPKKATAACGTVEVSFPDSQEETPAPHEDPGEDVLSFGEELV